MVRSGWVEKSHVDGKTQATECESEKAQKSNHALGTNCCLLSKVKKVKLFLSMRVRYGLEINTLFALCIKVKLMLNKLSYLWVCKCLCR